MEKFSIKKCFFAKNNYFLIILSIILISFLNFLFYSPLSVKAENDYKTQISTCLNRFYSNIESNIKNRTPGSDGEKYLANVLADFMAEKNLSFFNGATSYLHEFNLTDTKKSNNVIGLKNNNKEKYVVIGAHYDGYFIEDRSFGYSDNISGLAGLAVLVDCLTVEDYNIIFACFGAEEVGYKGSMNFVQSLPTEIRENILLFLNLDSIGAGDYLYYYNNDFGAKYNRAINDMLKDLNIKQYSNQLFSTKNTNDINYTNQPLSSDASSFLKYGINSLTLFAGNLSTWNGLGFYETTGHNKIMHNTDTKAVVDEVFGDKFVENINQAIIISESVLTNPELLTDTFSNGQIPTWAFSAWMLKGIGVCCVAVGFVAYLIYSKVKYRNLPESLKK